jgi:glycosyltransferase involved in cell wall biosynthesis
VTKIRVLFVITDLNFGGAEIMLRNLLTHMDSNAFEYEVVSLQNTGPIGEQIQEMGIQVHALNMNPQKPQLKSIFQLAKIIRKFHPDVINTWMYHADLMGSIAALFSGSPPVIWGIHHTVGDQEELKFSTRQIIRINRWLSHFCPNGLFAAQKQPAARILISVLATRKCWLSQTVTILQNFIRMKQHIPHFDMHMTCHRRQRLVGLFARYHPMKDHSTFIQAAGMIHKQIPDIVFLLAGSEIDGSNTALNAEIDSAGIRQNVLLLGIRKDIPALLSALDVYVSSSSRGEAFPMIIGEAMACGVPCVVTDVGDSCAIVGKTGQVVQPGQPEALAAAVLDMLMLSEEERHSLGNAARARVAAEYNLTSISQQYMQLFRDVFNDRIGDEH